MASPINISDCLQSTPIKKTKEHLRRFSCSIDKNASFSAEFVEVLATVLLDL